MSSYHRTDQIMRIVAEACVEGLTDRGFNLRDGARAAIETMEDEINAAKAGDARVVQGPKVYTQAMIDALPEADRVRYYRGEGLPESVSNERQQVDWGRGNPSLLEALGECMKRAVSEYDAETIRIAINEIAKHGEEPVVDMREAMQALRAAAEEMRKTLRKDGFYTGVFDEVFNDADAALAGGAPKMEMQEALVRNNETWQARVDHRDRVNFELGKKVQALETIANELRKRYLREWRQGAHNNLGCDACGCSWDTPREEEHGERCLVGMAKVALAACASEVGRPCGQCVNCINGAPEQCYASASGERSR